MNPYEILGLDPSASREQINKAFCDQVAKHHPNNGGDPIEFQKVQKAYEQLTGFDDTGAVHPPMAIVEDTSVVNAPPIPMAIVTGYDASPQNESIETGIDTGIRPTQTSRSNPVRTKRKPNRAMMQIVGVVLGGLSAVVVSYFILQGMGYFDAVADADGDPTSQRQRRNSNADSGSLDDKLSSRNRENNLNSSRSRDRNSNERNRDSNQLQSPAQIGEGNTSNPVSNSNDNKQLDGAQGVDMQAGGSIEPETDEPENVPSSTDPNSFWGNWYPLRMLFSKLNWNSTS